MTQPRRAKTAVRPHPFVLDTELPPGQDGRGVCRCGLVGERGDTHHTMPDAPADVQQLRAGERGDA